MKLSWWALDETTQCRFMYYRNEQNNPVLAQMGYVNSSNPRIFLFFSSLFFFYYWLRLALIVPNIWAYLPFVSLHTQCTLASFFLSIFFFCILFHVVRYWKKIQRKGRFFIPFFLLSRDILVFKKWTKRKGDAKNVILKSRKSLGTMKCF